MQNLAATETRHTGNEKTTVTFKDFLMLRYCLAVDGSNSKSGPLKQILSIDYLQVLTWLQHLVFHITYYRKLKFKCLDSPILHLRAMRKGLLMLTIQKATGASIYSSAKK